MRVVMTLLARDEADILDAQIAFHLHAGVDFVVATDNRSEDETTEILERYRAMGVLHLIHESGDDLRQSEWVTRMARLAATEFEADWVINADADEFWWPRAAGLKDVFAVIPRRYGVVRGAWRIFVPRPDDERPFYERMTVRLCSPPYHDHPFATHSNSAHRAEPTVRVGRGNHEAFADGLVPLRGWFPIEVLHFPLRSLEQCRRKYVTQFLALGRNPDKGTPGQIGEAYRAVLAGTFEDFYSPLVVWDEELERGLDAGSYAVDTRLRDVLRKLSRDERGAAFSAPSPDDPAFVFRRPDVGDQASFAAETSIIPESDLSLALGERIDDLEARTARMERRGLARVKGTLVRSLGK